jgi:hypothetical protein
MSNKERILQLIDDVPDGKLVFVVDMLESLKAYAGEAIKPDEWDLQMIAEAERENDGNTMTIDEVAKELGISI